MKEPRIIDGKCSHGAVSPCPVAITKRLDTAEAATKFAARISSMRQRV